jgi:hypothetical protein
MCYIFALILQLIDDGVNTGRGSDRWPVWGERRGDGGMTPHHRLAERLTRLNAHP